jgi:hypothetical protein
MLCDVCVDLHVDVCVCAQHTSANLTKKTNICKLTVHKLWSFACCVLSQLFVRVL